jgi:lipoyl(octanoyl) transferase
VRDELLVVRDELLVVRAGFGAGAMPYDEALDLQRRLHQRRAAGEIPDVCLLLEHQPVYTAGKRTTPLERPVGDPGAPVIDVDRGGKITWHGPGQLTGYPIVRLHEPVDVIGYVRKVEQAMIGTCAAFGVVADRVEGRSGAWVPGSPARKVAAIGIRVARGVTMHGFALNCDCDLSWFDRIIPCGIADASVTSLSAEAGRSIGVGDVLQAVEDQLAAALGAASVAHASAADLLGTPVA